MKWNFWKKEKKQLRELIVPEEELQKILVLWDSYNAKPNGQDREAKYLFWSAIADIFPEIKEGSWRLAYPRVFMLKIFKEEQCQKK